MPLQGEILPAGSVDRYEPPHASFVPYIPEGGNPDLTRPSPLTELDNAYYNERSYLARFSEMSPVHRKLMADSIKEKIHQDYPDKMAVVDQYAADGRDLQLNFWKEQYTRKRDQELGSGPGSTSVRLFRNLLARPTTFGQKAENAIGKAADVLGSGAESLGLPRGLGQLSADTLKSTLSPLGVASLPLIAGKSALGLATGSMAKALPEIPAIGPAASFVGNMVKQAPLPLWLREFATTHGARDPYTVEHLFNRFAGIPGNEGVLNAVEDVPSPEQVFRNQNLENLLNRGEVARVAKTLPGYTAAEVGAAGKMVRAGAVAPQGMDITDNLSRILANPRAASKGFTPESLSLARDVAELNAKDADELMFYTAKYNPEAFQRIAENYGKYFSGRRYAEFTPSVQETVQGIPKATEGLTGTARTSLNAAQKNAPSYLTRRSPYAEIISTALEQKKMIETYRVSEELAKGGAVFDRQLPGYEFIPASEKPRYGALAGKWVEKNTKDMFDTMHGTVHGTFSRFLRNYNSNYKMAVTVGNLPTQVKNFTSNVLTANAFGVPLWKIPRLLIQSTKDVATGSELLNESAKLGAFSSLPELDRLQEVIGHLQNIERDIVASGGRINPQRVVEELNRRLGGGSRFLEGASALYQGAEAQGRMMVIRSELEAAASLIQAVAKAKKVMFDYGDVPDMVKLFRGNPFVNPFITYSFKAAPRMAELATNNPAAFAKWNNLLRAANAQQSGIDQLKAQKYSLAKSDVLAKAGRPVASFMEKISPRLLVGTSRGTPESVNALNYTMAGSVINPRQIPIGLGLGASAVGKFADTAKAVSEAGAYPGVATRFGNILDMTSIGKTLVPSLQAAAPALGPSGAILASPMMSNALELYLASGGKKSRFAMESLFPQDVQSFLGGKRELLPQDYLKAFVVGKPEIMDKPILKRGAAFSRLAALSRRFGGVIGGLAVKRGVPLPLGGVPATVPAGNTQAGGQ